jgi:peptidyl-dipeptidase A
MGTLLHELGHGVYDVYIDSSLPFELRGPAHIFTTEGVAELFGMLTHDPTWLRRNGHVPDDAPANFDELVRAEHRLDLLIFARWTLVMLNFERELYTNPNRDLNDLWWDLVERYQYLHRPEDTAEGGFHWATKDHLVIAAVYYHNYMLGRMFAAQLRHRISEVVPETMTSGSFDMQGQPAVGRYLIENVFRPGKLYPWAEFVRHATGEELTARYFAEEIQPPPAPASPPEPAEGAEGTEGAEPAEDAEGNN